MANDMSLLDELFGQTTVKGAVKQKSSRSAPSVTFGRPSAEVLKTQKEQAKIKQTVTNEKKKKARISEFDNSSDFVLTMILVALMHTNPDITPADAIKEGKKWAKQLSTPDKDYLWRLQSSRIRRYGIRAEASKIRREMFKLI